MYLVYHFLLTSSAVNCMQPHLAIWQCAFVHFLEHVANHPKARCYTASPFDHSMDTASDMDSVGSSIQRYNCVCSTHNFGQPHSVSSATWYHHFEEAQTDEEQQRMQSAKFEGLNNSSARHRGTASRRRNNALPIQERAREVDAQDTSAPEKRGRSGDNKVGSSSKTSS